MWEPVMMNAPMRQSMDDAMTHTKGFIFMKFISIVDGYGDAGWE